MKDNEYIFGTTMVLTNLVETLLDRELSEYGITYKQWYLSMVISGMLENEPTLSQAANAMGSSHQNVKQIAMRLQEKEMMELYKDKLDKRAIRIRITEKGKIFWDSIKDRAERFVSTIFKGIDADTSATIRKAIDTIYRNIYLMAEEKGGSEND